MFWTWEPGPWLILKPKRRIRLGSTTGPQDFGIAVRFNLCGIRYALCGKLTEEGRCGSPFDAYVQTLVTPLACT